MTGHTETADERLVRDTLAGKQEAFSVLVERYHAAMHALAFAQTGNHADADDVAQEGFLKAYRSLNGLRDGRKFGGWLAVIVRNKARSMMRQRQQRAEVAIEPDAAIAPSDLESRELRALLKAQIDQMDEAQREVLLLHYFADMNAREIGEVLGLSKFAVQKRLQRARDVLGSKVVDLLGGEAEHRDSATARNRQIMGIIAAMPLPWAVSSAQAATTVPGVPVFAFKFGVAGVVVASAVVAIGAFIGLPPGSAPNSETTATQEQIAWLTANSGREQSTTAAADPAAKEVAPAGTAEKPDITGVAIDAESGHGVPDITIAMGAERAREFVKFTTGPEGKFAFSNVPSGEYLVAVMNTGPFILTGGEPGFDPMAFFEVPGLRIRVGTGHETLKLRLEVARGGVIEGRVLDETTRKAVPDARVYAARSFKEGWTPLGTFPSTDANGHYRIEGLLPREYKIVCDWSIGFRTDLKNSLRATIIRPGEHLKLGDILIDYGISVTGRVVDQNGVAVDAAEIWGSWRSGNDLRGGQAKSKADGSFALKGVGYKSGGRLYLQASKGAGLSNIDGPWAIPHQGLDDIVLTLAKGASITGVATDASGRPLADAAVTAAHEPDRRANLSLADFSGDQAPPGDFGYGKDTRTGPDGSYRIEGLNPGNYGMQVTGPGEKPADYFTMTILKRVYVEAGQELSSVNLVMGQPEIDGPAISGTVRNALGRPLAKVRVMAFLPTGFPASPVETDESGAYRIGGLENGPFTVRAEQAGFSPASVEGIEIGASNVDLVLLPSGSIDGLVLRTDNGAPVAEFEIATINGITDDFSNLGESFKPINDAQGRFHLDDLSEGSHTIFVKARGFIIASQAIENLQPGQALSNVVVALEAADSISGIVVTDTGEPVPNAMILTPHSRIDFARQGIETPETTTDSEGRFTLDTFVPDLQHLIAVHRDYAPEIAAVPVSGSGRSDVRIVLTQGGSVEGTVSGIEDVAPGATVHVRVWYPEEPEKGPIDIPCAPDGTYSYRNLAPGTVELTASTVLREPSVAMKRTVTIAEGESVVTDFNFEPFDASIEGHVTGAGETWNRARIIASSTREDGTTLMIVVQVNPDGSYRVAGLPPGPATLNLLATRQDDTGFSKEVDAETVEGETLEVNFEP